jgi:hypothetical protein
MKKDKKKWKIRIIKSDLPELKERIQFLTGHSWDISIGVDGVEGVDDHDGRMVVNKIPKDWCAEAVKDWLRKRIASRREVTRAMEQEIVHLQFVRDLVSRQIEDFKDKGEK